LRGLAALLLATACAACAPEPAPLGARDPDVPVASQVDVTAARLQGAWRVVESSRLAPGAQLVFGAGTLQTAGAVQPLQALGQGRFRLPDGPLWVHWMDADGRTAAIGDPRAGWFAILDRRGDPGDRLAAAREILQWYGYDLAQAT
jgi:apolipoprotein D and lipocalin family protein